MYGVASEKAKFVKNQCIPSNDRGVDHVEDTQQKYV